MTSSRAPNQHIHPEIAHNSAWVFVLTGSLELFFLFIYLCSYTSFPPQTWNAKGSTIWGEGGRDKLWLRLTRRPRSIHSHTTQAHRNLSHASWHNLSLLSPYFFLFNFHQLFPSFSSRWNISSFFLGAGTYCAVDFLRRHHAFLTICVLTGFWYNVIC